MPAHACIVQSYKGRGDKMFSWGVVWFVWEMGNFNLQRRTHLRGERRERGLSLSLVQAWFKFKLIQKIKFPGIRRNFFKVRHLIRNAVALSRLRLLFANYSVPDGSRNMYLNTPIYMFSNSEVSTFENQVASGMGCTWVFYCKHI